MNEATRRHFLLTTGMALTTFALGCSPKPEDDSGDDRARDTAAGADTGAPDTDTVAPDTDSAAPDTDTAACEETPLNPEGPYYQAGVPVREELDLYGHEGERLTIVGTVRDTACAPIASAVVELWHADPDGLYDNDSPEMRYRGQVATDVDGAWRFHTLMPGRYPGRPLHLHMKFWVDGVERLTTQVYFEGQPDNGGIPAELIVPLAPDGEGAWAATFDAVV